MKELWVIRKKVIKIIIFILSNHLFVEYTLEPFLCIIIVLLSCNSIEYLFP